MVKAAPHAKIVRKKTTKFKRFQSDRFMRVASAWRRPVGIDNPMRRKYRGQGLMPGKGFRTNVKTRFMSNDGFKRLTIHNVAELDTLMMHNDKYAAVIARTVSARKRNLIVQRARALDIKVVNEKAKLKAEEHE